MTWNLWAFYTGGDARVHAIIETLKGLDPDICCLQEVRSDGVEDLAATLGHAWASRSNGRSRWPASGGSGASLTAPWK